MIDGGQAETFARCMRVGGVAVFPADTVYGLACDPQDKEAVRRLYALKARSTEKPSAVMFFDLELALAALPELGPRTVGAVRALLPGPIGLLLPNPAHRYGLACGLDPDTLGLRVPDLPAAAFALHTVKWPVLQSSANRAGGADPRAVGEIDRGIREHVDLVLDAGELPGTPSTMVDLRAYEDDGTWSVVREGAVATDEIARRLH
ncbi:MAG: Sua5/YciO/YrdC/YwlC family protein [Solirubrobacteraceae bacterium]|nr:Sua5/YciO/YrdC/YwlC family protein [Solirubrobacteraceae bacterium]